ncbi:kelch domain-containing protein 3-like [Daktulosphaira vitifoliae]|uniref:kelch domain-containing protein 3-like n=1 Tax=Daktulosphaira vitifoliae TaxID=58002 RepID=UPI0021AA38EC|nr:kelch domain-containing protein 3-like [Daktulosphaira vitifoliae]
MYWTFHMHGGPRRVNHAAVAIDSSIFTFGGYCSGADYKNFKPIDIHVLDTIKLKWWKLELQDHECENTPFQRYGHTAVAYNNNVFLWGGRNDKETCNTLYCFDTHVLKWSIPVTFGNKPVPRDGHSACIINYCMYIYGGFQESQFSQDLCMFDFRSMTWHKIRTEGTPPSLRDFHTATAIDNKMYVFGGRGDVHAPRITDREVYCSEIYYFDTTTHTWIRPNVYSNKPPGRRSHSAFYHNGFLYIFGGFNRNMNLHFQDINRYDPTSSTWMTITPKGVSPCARRRQICLVIENRVFISGGTSPIPPKPPIPLRQMDYDLTEQLFNQLKDHDDLHILDLNPSLKDMCLVKVWEKLEEEEINFDDLDIPKTLKNDLAAVDPFEVIDTGVVDSSSPSYEIHFPPLPLPEQLVDLPPNPFE